jgi:L-fuculose-phosphate aldolase
MHLRSYQQRADVQAVVHAHPPVATGFGVAGKDLMDDVLPEAIFLLGGVPLVAYANHGANTVGPTLVQAH